MLIEYVHSIHLIRFIPDLVPPSDNYFFSWFDETLNNVEMMGDTIIITANSGRIPSRHNRKSTGEKAKAFPIIVHYFVSRKRKHDNDGHNDEQKKKAACFVTFFCFLWFGVSMEAGILFQAGPAFLVSFLLYTIGDTSERPETQRQQWRPVAWLCSRGRS